jgi:hypothetical protein
MSNDDKPYADKMNSLPWSKTTLSGKEADLEYYKTHGSAPQPIGASGQHGDYWVLSQEDRKKGFVRPVRTSYKHLKCGSVTSMGNAIAETYAANPKYYGATFCATCGVHSPVGENGDFIWIDGSEEKVGT